MADRFHGAEIVWDNDPRRADLKTFIRGAKKMKKKTVLVETSRSGKTWSIKVSGTDAQARSAMGYAVQDMATRLQLQILNATDPFSEVKARRRKKGNAEAIKALKESEAVLKS